MGSFKAGGSDKGPDRRRGKHHAKRQGFPRLEWLEGRLLLASSVLDGGNPIWAPTNNNVADIHLPTDGYKAPTDLGRVLMGQLGSGTSGGTRPTPTVAEPTGGAPAFGADAPVLPATPPVSAAPAPTPAPAPRREEPAAVSAPPQPKAKKGSGAAAAPGFSL